MIMDHSEIITGVDFYGGGQPNFAICRSDIHILPIFQGRGHPHFAK